MRCWHGARAPSLRAVADMMAAPAAVTGEIGVGCGKGVNGLFRETNAWSPGLQAARRSETFCRGAWCPLDS